MTMTRKVVRHGSSTVALPTENRSDVLQGMPSERTAADLAYLLHSV